MVKPSNLLELFVALRNVLEALIVLHRELVIHRDIRWSNVIKRRDCDSWFLIDFDDAAISPQYFPSGEHLSKEEHAPEIFVSGSIHTTAVDIWAVGYLIETSNVQWDDFTRRTAFTNRLLQEDPTRRPTAKEALCDLAKHREETKQGALMNGESCSHLAF
jgi:serine/threonine protein kinase